MTGNTAPDAHAAFDRQQNHWQFKLSTKPDMFGEVPSASTRSAAARFDAAGLRNILELGAGQGRDTSLFLQRGFHVTALDYSAAGVEAINKKIAALGLSQMAAVRQHDVRLALPAGDNSFDACYSHMLYCMAFSWDELLRLSAEVHRVLRPGGLQVYTVRTVRDPHFNTGVPLGDNVFETSGGYIVRFFDEAMVRRLLPGFELVAIEEFEEDKLPKRLFAVTVRKIVAP